MKRIGFLFLEIAVLIPFVFLTSVWKVSAETDNSINTVPHTISFTLYENHVNKSFHGEFEYCDSMLTEHCNENRLLPDLAKASVYLSEAVYNRSGSTPLSSIMYNQMGYAQRYTSKWFTEKMTYYDRQHVAFEIGSKTANGKTIYLVVVRGTCDDLEWYSDFDYGTGNFHRAFYLCAKEISDELKTIIQEDREIGVEGADSIVWTTGHSRGAAVSNLLAGLMSTDSNYSAGIPASNIFSYNFACPSVTRNDTGNLKNIYNFNNPYDLIPAMPLESEGWDFKRYGVTETLSLTDGNFYNLQTQFSRRVGKEYSYANINPTVSFIHDIVPDLEAANDPEKMLIVKTVVTFALTHTSDCLPDIFLDYLAEKFKMTELDGSARSAFVTAIKAGEFISAYDIFKNNASILTTYKDFLSIVKLCKLLINIGPMWYEAAVTPQEVSDSEDLRIALINAENYLYPYETGSKEWNEWIANNQELLQKVEKETGIIINTKEDLYSAESCIGTQFSDTRNLIMDLCSLLFQENSTALKANLTHGHLPTTYELWINSMYYGYQGWYGSEALDSFNPSKAGTTIGRECFYNASGEAKKIEIPDSISTVRERAFCNSAIEELEISGPETTIGTEAFRNCLSLTKLTIPADFTAYAKTESSGFTTTYGSFHNSSNIQTIHYTKGKTGVVSGGSSSPADVAKANLKNVILDEGITEIGTSAFANCSALKSIDLPDGLTKIGNSAFANSAIEKLYISDNVKTFGTNVFGTNKSVEIYGWKNSPAETFAANQGLTFRPVCSPFIEPEIDEICKGEEVSFTGNMYTKDCECITDADWSVRDQQSENTSVSEDGILTVGEDEESEKIILIAELKGSDQTVYSCEKEIRVKEAEKPLQITAEPELSGVYGTKVSEMTLGDGEVRQGDEVVTGEWTVTDENSDDCPDVGTSAEYEVTFTSGTKTVKTTVVPSVSPRDVNSEDISFETESADLVYDGSEQVPVLLADDSSAVITDSDYTAVYENNINAGTAAVIITGKNNYTGERTIHFMIQQADLQNAEITLSETEYEADGEEKRPAAEVRLGDLLLREDTDYTLTYEDNVDPGTARAVITAVENGNFTGSSYAEFTIREVTHVHVLVKTEGKEPGCTEDGNTEYWTCTECGKYFSDENGETEIAENSWVIPAHGHTWGEWTVVKEAAADEEGLERRVCMNDPSHTEERVIPKTETILTKVEATEATCEEDGNTEYWTDEEGRYYADAEGTEEITPESTVIPALGHDWDEGVVTREPSYTEEGVLTHTCRRNPEHTYTEPIARLNQRPIDNAEVVLSSISYTYSGTENKPEVTVTLDGQELTQDTDYTAAYADNINAGTAAVIITGTGEYSGTVVKNYTIEPKEITPVVTLAETSYTYDGTAKKPAATVKDGAVTLTKNVDYTVSYPSGRINAGKYTVTVKLKGNYAGTGTASFTINKAPQTITATAASTLVSAGKTTTIRVSGAQGSVSYTSQDTSIATVSPEGLVTARKVGTVRISVASAATSNYKKKTVTVTITVVPGATSKIAAANQATGIKIAWKPVSGATGYKIYRDGALAKTITGGSTVNWVDTKANTNGQKYTYKIVAYNASGKSTLSASLVTYRLARPAVSSLTNSAAGKLTVKWGRNAKGTGYQIQYSTGSSFAASATKTVTVAANTTVSKVISSLTKGKTYYVRIRTYKTVSGKKYYSAWSTVKYLKITK